MVLDSNFESVNNTDNIKEILDEVHYSENINECRKKEILIYENEYIISKNEAYEGLKNSGMIKTAGTRIVIYTVILLLAIAGFIAAYVIRNNINDLIYSSDIVLSKPGGLSSTEISSLNKPLIHINPIPGIENYNATFFCKRGMSIICRNNDDIVSNIEKLLTDKELYNNMVLSDKKYMSEVGIEKLIDLIKSMEGKKV